MPRACSTLSLLRVLPFLAISFADPLLAQPLQQAGVSQQAGPRPAPVVDWAAQFVPGSEIAAAVNVPADDLKLEGALFIPDRAAGKKLRAVLVVIDWGYVAELLGGYNPYSAMHHLARDLDCGLLRVRISRIHPRPPGPVAPNEQPQRYAATGSGDGLLRLLEKLAVETKRQELESAPLLFWGWSAAGGFGPSFARLQPTRTLGLIQYQSHRRGIVPDWSVLPNIPMLIVIGGEQQKEQNDDSIVFWNEGRSRGAPWALVQQRGIDHELKSDHLGALDPFLVPWVEGVIQGRLGGSTGGRLSVMPLESGWVGVHAAGAVLPASSFTGPQEGTSWFPSERAARAWLAVIGK